MDIEMRPRQAIVPVLWAIGSGNADKLNGHDWSDLLVGGGNDPSQAKIRADKVDLQALRALESRVDALATALDQERSDVATLAANSLPIVGEIRAFGFDGEPYEGQQFQQNIDELEKLGWIECRGQPMPKSVYPKLYAKVGARWGRKDEQTVLFPDLRGTFLRGWNHAAISSDFTGDPDIATREASRPGEDRDRVGSSEASALQDHKHKEFATFPGYNHSGSSPQMFGFDQTDPSTAFTGKVEALSIAVGTSIQETRPKNKYVLYAVYVGR